MASKRCPSSLILEPTACTSLTCSTVPAGMTTGGGGGGASLVATGVPGVCVAEPAGCAVLPGCEEGVEDGEDGAPVGGADCAGGCDACSGFDELLLHPVFARNTSGRIRAASLRLFSIRHLSIDR